jgi:hypothetical protein
MPGNIVIKKYGSEKDFLQKLTCKLIMQIQEYNGNNPFTKDFVINLILQKVKFTTDTTTYIGSTIKQKVKQVNATREEATAVWNGLVKAGFVLPAGVIKRDKYHPKAPVAGVQVWKLEQYAVTQCQQTSWYKASTRKRAWREKHLSLDTQRCRALRHLYSMFGTSPFSYEQATGIAKYMKQLTEIKNSGLTDRDKKIIKSVTRTFEISTADFRKIWNSLIQNNYITRWKTKTPRGYVTTNSYVINKAYLRRCLGALEI